MEYEGYGCPELFNIYQSAKKESSTARPTTLNINHKINFNIGETHNTLQNLIKTGFIQKNIDGENNFLFALG